MNNTWKKILAIGLSVTMIVGAGTAYASYADSKDENKSISDNVNEIISTISEGTEEANVYQDETVFVIASDKGDVQKLIVNDKVRDHVNGTETFTQNESSSEVPVEIRVSYKLDGRDIEPAALAGRNGHVTITYDYVNREAREVEILGESKTMYVPFAVITGVLLDSKVFSNVTVSGGRVVGDGNRLVALGIGFPGLTEDLKTNGLKDMEDKAKEDNIDSEKLAEIPENFVIEADVTDFKLGNSYSLVTNLSLGNSFSDEKSVSEVLGGISGQAADAMNSLLDGSIQLHDGLVSAEEGSIALCDGAKSAYEGAGQLADGAAAAYDGSVQLADGAAAAYQGAGQLKAGAASAYEGAGQLASGAASAYQGVDQLAAGAASAYEGAGQLNAGLQSAGTGAATLSAGIGQVSTGLTTLDKNSATLVAGAEQVFASLLASADEGLAGAGLTVPKLTKDNYAAVIDGTLAAMNQQAEDTLAQYRAAAAAGMVTPEMQAQIMAGKQALEAGAAKLTELKASLDSYNAFYQGIVAYTAGVGQAAAGLSQVAQGADSLNTGLTALSEGAASLTDGLGTLSGGTASLKDGLGTLSAGAASLSDGLGTLSDGLGSLGDGLGTLAVGTGSLKDGLETLADGNASLAEGLGTLSDGTVTLHDGLVQLSDGSAQLSDGLQQLNDELVSKILSFLDTDATELADTLKALADISNDYKSIHNLGSAEDGSVKFIYKLGAIK